MAVHTLDRIGIASFAKMYAALMFIYGVVVGLPMLMFGSVVDSGAGIGMFLGVVIASVIFGAIAGAITAGVYNLLAGTVGGVELHLSEAAPGDSRTAGVDAGVEAHD